MDSDHWLSAALAEVEKKRKEIDLGGSLYGAADIAAKYCGLSSPPTPLPGHWQHGWKAPHRQLTAQYEMGELEPLSPDERFWVARRDQEDCLKRAGLKNSRAIGLPCVYLPTTNVERRPNTLLVMPAHSLDYTRHDWKFEEYADQIASIRDDFDEVIACVHKSCFDRGLWVDSFRKRQIPVVVGAHTSDPLTLHRQQAMLSCFEFVTTNSHGSHLAYGAYWGARVSIYGTYADLRAEDFSNTPFYQRYPELVRPAVAAINETAMREHYPQLFVDHPRDAKDLADWGAMELGADNRLPPQELQQAFSWRWSDRMSTKFSRVTKRLAQAIVPRSIRRKFEREPDTNKQTKFQLEKEIADIAACPTGELSTKTLLGHQVEFRDGPSAAGEIRSLFVDEVVRFHTPENNPRIIDVGTGVGWTSIYLAHLHPGSSILAFEPYAEEFELLQKNCNSFGFRNVKLDDRKVVSTVDDSTHENQSVPLKELLQERVEFLRLNVGPDELDLFESCREELDKVERILVVYRGNFNRNQQLSGLIGLLEESGFRIHLHNLNPAAQPLVHRPVISGCDLQLNIFGVRERG